MAVDREQRRGDRRCFNCRGFRHIVRNCTTERPVDRNGKVIWIDKGEDREKKLKDNGG